MKNYMANSTFSAGRSGGLPEGWSLNSPRPSVAPVFKLVRKNGRKVLLAAGNGREDCVGHVSAPVSVKAGRTYRLRARLQVSPDLNLHQSLLFGFYTQHFNNGIFRFTRAGNGCAEGEGRFRVPGKGVVDGDVRVHFRWSAGGKAWIHEVSLTECAAVPPRPVTVTCVQGTGDLKTWGRVLDTAGKAGVDLILLPESISGSTQESLCGPSATLMADKARQHRMYVAGGIYYHDRKADELFNTALLFDRRGRRRGRYDKNHPYTPEILGIVQMLMPSSSMRTGHHNMERSKIQRPTTNVQRLKQERATYPQNVQRQERP